MYNAGIFDCRVGWALSSRLYLADVVRIPTACSRLIPFREGAPAPLFKPANFLQRGRHPREKSDFFSKNGIFSSIRLVPQFSDLIHNKYACVVSRWQKFNARLNCASSVKNKIFGWDCAKTPQQIHPGNLGEHRGNMKQKCRKIILPRD